MSQTLLSSILARPGRSPWLTTPSSARRLVPCAAGGRVARTVSLFVSAIGIMSLAGHPRVKPGSDASSVALGPDSVPFPTNPAAGVCPSSRTPIGAPSSPINPSVPRVTTDEAGFGYSAVASHIQSSTSRTGTPIPRLAAVSALLASGAPLKCASTPLKHKLPKRKLHPQRNSFRTLANIGIVVDHLGYGPTFLVAGGAAALALGVCLFLMPETASVTADTKSLPARAT